MMNEAADVSAPKPGSLAASIALASAQRTRLDQQMTGLELLQSFNGHSLKSKQPSDLPVHLLLAAVRER